ncbi:MAG: flippase-like domain-containing protein [Bacteroidetes bacterium]|nr:flippase-like domain-containing protein [Bacteroidota bacterium]HET6243490.1 lysylphosphatidylglycerol synthase domain-containing protein [Bacteroidia bacterium]
MKTNLAKYDAFLILFVKSLVICLSFWFIYHRIFISQDFAQFESAFKNAFLAPTFFPLLSVVCILFLINWGTEAYKWKMIIKKLQIISFPQSFKAVFSGITVGLFTPNRVGEYGGRIIYLNRSNRTNAVVIAIAGNLSQLLTTLVFGILGVIFYYLYFSQLNIGFISLVLLLIIPICFFLFFNIRKIPVLFGSKIEKYLRAFAFFSNLELIKLVFLSTLRYLMFFLQFYILLLIFKIEIQILDALVLLPVIFLVISVIPTFALVEWGVRGSAALFFVGAVSSNSAGILAAATMLWLINIAFPALLGVMFIANHKLSINEY